MKVCKVEMLVIDFDELGEHDMKQELECVSYPNDCIHPNVMKITSKDIAWSDNHPLNVIKTQESAYNELFGSELNTSETETLWVGAFRYYLGRMTGATHDFIDMLTKEWKNLSKSCRHTIITDLRRAVDEHYNRDESHINFRSPLGMQPEIDKWIDFSLTHG